MNGENHSKGEIFEVLIEHKINSDGSVKKQNKYWIYDTFHDDLNKFQNPTCTSNWLKYHPSNLNLRLQENRKQTSKMYIYVISYFGQNGEVEEMTSLYFL